MAYQDRNGRPRCAAWRKPAQRPRTRSTRSVKSLRTSNACTNADRNCWRVAGPAQLDAVRCAVSCMGLRRIESPLDIADAMRTRLLAAPKEDFDPDGWPEESAAAAPGRAWIFTSATLGDDAQLTWFTERAGLEGASILRVESPFDYAAQAALYVPRHLPAPADPAHSAALAH